MRSSKIFAPAGTVIKNKKRVNHDHKIGMSLEGWSLLYDIKLEEVKVPHRKYRPYFKCTEFSLNNQLKQCKTCH